MFKRVLVPTDGSKTAEAAVDLAVSLAAECDAVVYALYVIETVPRKLDRPPIVDADPRETDCDAIKQVQRQAEQCGVTEVTGAIAAGYPFQEIVRYIETRRVDVVVMGANTKSGVAGLLSRNTPHLVRRKASVPALVTSDSAGEDDDSALPEPAAASRAPRLRNI